MSGHNKWSQIKHRKEAVDKKKGLVFSKFLRAISAAAKTEPNPDMNPRLRSLIETARAANIPNDNIARAISRASEEKDLKELIIEAYGPEKVAIIIECLTDNSNRTVAEVRNILSETGGKMGEMGSARWAFDNPSPGVWTPKYPQAITPEGKMKLDEIIAALENHDDVQNVYTNTN
jgi:YebC/PmpR family DNA-binding regulatory protein